MRGLACLATGCGTCGVTPLDATGGIGCIGARGCMPVAHQGPRGCTGVTLAGCCAAADCGALLPVFAAGWAGVGTLGAGGLAALGELTRLPRLDLLRAAFSALARRSCSACAAIALHTLSLTSFHKASCSSALANSSMRTGAP